MNVFAAPKKALEGDICTSGFLDNTLVAIDLTGKELPSNHSLNRELIVHQPGCKVADV